MFLLWLKWPLFVINITVILKAIQEDIAASGSINAVFYAVHPFSNENVMRLTQGALYDFDVTLNSDFINTCNNGDIFLDSALVINDGVFGGRGAWKDKLDNKGKHRKFPTTVNFGSVFVSKMADEIICLHSSDI